jgi:hypothetical protein
MNYLYRTEPEEIPPALQLSPPVFNLDVRRHGIDPFLSSVAIGAVAGIIGMLLGLCLFLPI